MEFGGKLKKDNSNKKNKAKKGQIRKIIKSHLVDMWKDFKDEASTNAEAQDIDLKILKPNLKEMKEDLVKAVKNLKTGGVSISKDEVIEIYKSGVSQLKAAVTNNKEELTTEEDEFLAKLDSLDFDSDDFDLSSLNFESVSTDVENLSREEGYDDEYVSNKTTSKSYKALILNVILDCISSGSEALKVYVTNNKDRIIENLLYLYPTGVKCHIDIEPEIAIDEYTEEEIDERFKPSIDDYMGDTTLGMESSVSLIEENTPDMVSVFNMLEVDQDEIYDDLDFEEPTSYDECKTIIDKIVGTVMSEIDSDPNKECSIETVFNIYGYILSGVKSEENPMLEQSPNPTIDTDLVANMMCSHFNIVNQIRTIMGVSSYLAAKIYLFFTVFELRGETVDLFNNILNEIR